MSAVQESVVLDWVANFTSIPRAKLENGSNHATTAAPEGNDVAAPAPGGGAAPGGGGAPGGPASHAKSMGKGETVGADMRAFEERFKRVTGQIIHTVEINALLLGSGIEAACLDFKKYADDKVEKIKEQEEIDKLATEVLEVVATAVSGGFAAVMIEGEIAKEVFKTLAETTIKVVKAKAEPNTSAGFTKFVDSMIMGAKIAGHDAGSNAIGIVRGTINAAEKAFEKARNYGVSLSASKEYKFVEPFLFAELSHFDHLVTRYVGIPTPSMVNKLQIKMTGNMIQRFAEKYIRALEDGVTNVVVDDAGWKSFQVSEDAMRKLKKQHGFNYED